MARTIAKVVSESKAPEAPEESLATLCVYAGSINFFNSAWKYGWFGLSIYIGAVLVYLSLEHGHNLPPESHPWLRPQPRLLYKVDCSLEIGGDVNSVNVSDPMET